MTNLVNRFYAAVSALAGDGHIKQRLIRAYQDNLDEIEDDELPIAMREPFAELTARMHNVAPLNGEGPVRASVRKMSCPEAGKCGESIVDLYAQMLKHADSAQVDLPLSQDDAAPLPPFLVKSAS
ncbi:MAG: hypothetical protein KJO82_09150 [Gammaproteobacteria bacterium]|nr:hypothetical protein [Gammaproteobacteria bacterium]NNC77539.1 hypothetical protein [Woeseiaceae bacterium]